MSRPTKRFFHHQGVLIETGAPGEWIVGVPAGGRRLHVYRVDADDWLVSEVGRGNEGRGVDLVNALAALAADGAARDWWRLVPAALDDLV